MSSIHSIGSSVTTNFCEWGSLKYLNKLAVDNYGKKVNEFNSFKY
jgi:hypothetical protein